MNYLTFYAYPHHIFNYNSFIIVQIYRFGAPAIKRKKTLNTPGNKATVSAVF
jgi:hypothetical protein